MKDDKPDTLAVINNYNFCDTHIDIHTDGPGNFMPDPAQRASMSCVTYTLSLNPTATATDPPPAKSPTMHSSLVCKDQKNSNC